MRPHYVTPRLYITSGPALEEELRAAFVRRRVFTPLGDPRKLELAAGKDGEERSERRRTKVTIGNKRQ